MERQFIDRTGTSYPVLLRASKVGRRYGLGHTSYVVVGHDGVVRYITTQPFAPPIVRQAINRSLELLAESRKTGEGSETFVGEQESLPRRFALLSNYPNPFNAETTIGFHLDAATEATIRVFDASGRSVRLLTSGRYGPGAYTSTWDGRDDAGRPAASGVYFYRLSAPDHRVARSMVLLR